MPVAMSGVVKRVGMDRGGCRKHKRKSLFYFLLPGVTKAQTNIRKFINEILRKDNLSHFISDDNKVTGYGLDNQQFSSSRAKSFLFINIPRPVLGNTKLPVRCILGIL